MATAPPGRCIDEFDAYWFENLRSTKAGKPRVVNRYPTTCRSCGDALEPGEGIVADVDTETGFRWSCGPGRWQRR